jgi:hypothetical protein
VRPSALSLGAWTCALAWLAACGRVGFDGAAADDGHAAGSADATVDSGSGSGKGSAGCPAPRFFCDDFESGDLGKWTGSDLDPGGTVVVDQIQAHSGSFALDATMPANASSAYAFAYAAFPRTTTGELAVREWVLPFSAPIDYDLIFDLFDPPSDHYASPGGDGSGMWAVTEEPGQIDHPSTAAAGSGAWTCVELDYRFAGSDAGEIALYVNDAVVLDTPPADTAVVFSQLDVGATRAQAAGFRLLVDDVVLSTAHIGCE